MSAWRPRAAAKSFSMRKPGLNATGVFAVSLIFDHVDATRPNAGVTKVAGEGSLVVVTALFVPGGNSWS